jgi:6-pyruvoyltetrahydropterin/6-carboxytetrahydropterin synthase
MYTLAVQRSFEALHFLVGGDWGDENHLHTHAYRLEIALEAFSLDQHGYCVDVVAVNAALDGLMSRFAGRVLNEDPAFLELNPSIEHFSRIALEALEPALAAPNLAAAIVTIWESDIARASFRRELQRPA